MPVILLGIAVGSAALAGFIWRWMRFNIASPAPVLSGIRGGILAFLLWDLLSTAYRPLDEMVSRLRDGQDDATPVWENTATFAAGLLLGFVVIASLWTRARRTAVAQRPELVALAAALRCGWAGLCAGLAVGASEVSGSLWLTVLLVLGWAALNVFEGAGIVLPYVASEYHGHHASQRPGSSWVVSLAVIAGLPTVAGVLLGELSEGDVSTVACLSLAAGAATGLLLHWSAEPSPTRVERHGGAAGYAGALVSLVALVTLIGGFVASMLVTLGGVGA
ncbi:MAG: hypothetical protein J2P17_21055 [Mycobacterium sp.]|nr:hypothetical protein [Mycobacterium sp.]